MFRCFRKEKSLSTLQSARSTLAVLFCAVLVGYLLVGAALAQEPARQEPARQDRVTLRAVAAKPATDWNVIPLSEMRGTIQSFDHLALTLAVVGSASAVDGTLLKFDSQQVQGVSFAWKNEAIENALQLFDEHKYRESISALNEARKVNTPRWQQQFVIARIIQAAVAMGNTRTAGTLFVDLAASQPPAILYADMPLCWTVRDVEKPLLDSAKDWLASDSEEARLLGASWQLLGSERELASKTLSKLQSSSNQAIAALAVAQSWRLVPPPNTLAEYEKWLAFRDGMLLPLQLGPTEFLADRMQRVGEIDLALEQWMRIATLHADRYDRKLRALKAAAENLTRAGRAEEAKRIEIWIVEMEGT